LVDTGIVQDALCQAFFKSDIAERCRPSYYRIELFAIHRTNFHVGVLNRICKPPVRKEAIREVRTNGVHQLDLRCACNSACAHKSQKSIKKAVPKSLGTAVGVELLELIDE
jgi:hypothetical protein